MASDTHIPSARISFLVEHKIPLFIYEKIIIVLPLDDCKGVIGSKLRTLITPSAQGYGSFLKRNKGMLSSFQKWIP